MLFNSIQFALFLPVVFMLYWRMTKKCIHLQNLLLLAASGFFYACWDWRFLFLLLLSIVLVYYPAKWMMSATNNTHRKLWFWFSIIASVGLLGIFKYYNFFVASFVAFFNHFGLQVHPTSLQLILPVGISFYTFHGLSYLIDLSKGRIEEERSFVNYALFVSFFPLLVAGPIERATHLLPQFKAVRTFEFSKAVDGLKQILWGLFKKVVIADQCAEYANQIFNHSTDYSGSTLALGAFFFAIQIYGDFSGYSDIALGTARLFGIELLRNFAYPYFSRDIAEFWRRWHISLTTWFRDYLYIPLGGSRGNTWTTIRNTFFIFLISGFWHGANWTFVFWGALNAVYFLPLILTRNNRKHLDTVAEGKLFPELSVFFSMCWTFLLTVVAWIFFRAESISHAFAYLSEIFSPSFFTFPDCFSGWGEGVKIGALVLMFFTIEWLGREQPYAIARFFHHKSKWIRWTFYYAMVCALCFFMGKEQQFIYFQF